MTPFDVNALTPYARSNLLRIRGLLDESFDYLNSVFEDIPDISVLSAWLASSESVKATVESTLPEKLVFLERTTPLFSINYLPSYITDLSDESAEENDISEDEQDDFEEEIPSGKAFAQVSINLIEAFKYWKLLVDHNEAPTAIQLNMDAMLNAVVETPEILSHAWWFKAGPVTESKQGQNFVCLYANLIVLRSLLRMCK